MLEHGNISFHISCSWIYHVYQDVFTPSIGQKLVAKRELNNTMDKQAVKVVKGDETVGHLPRKFS